MKTSWTQSWVLEEREPIFILDLDERAIVISALQTFTRSFPQDETAKRMLHTFEQMDLAIRAIFGGIK